MPQELFINTGNELRPHEDYAFLKAEGIRLIEKLSGKIWTNYNSHDPGITLLEALCYALTDLGYRTSFEIKDLLAPDLREPDWTNVFHTANQILPTNPTTITDFRKLIIDTEGVKNAWVEVSSEYEVLLYLNAAENTNPADAASYSLDYDSASDTEPMRLRGLYKITVDYEEDVIIGSRQQLVDESIRKKLNAHRNLCEDFLSIKPVNYEYFVMETEVQVFEGVDIEQVAARILLVIHDFFSPYIKFYTLDQMLQKYAIEEIFEGPALEHGFIDGYELENSERYMDIHLSDIINLISGIPGVIAVKKCVFPIETQTAFSDFTQWITNVKQREKAPKLDLDKSVVRFTRSGDRHRTEKEKTPDKKRVRDVYNFLQSQTSSAKIKGAFYDVSVPRGDYMSVADYYPFQYSLPASYGMQEQVVDPVLAASYSGGSAVQDNSALAGLINTPRARQILQLRGFLMVFEQIMADNLSQLANITRLFSFDPAVSQTYYPQALQDVLDMSVLVMNAKTYEENGRSLVETNKQFLQKRSDILGHLMARVGESNDAYSPSARVITENMMRTAIRNKIGLLSDYIRVSSYRGKAFDFSNPDTVWDTDNVIGMKRRICRLLGMEEFDTTFLSTGWISIDTVQHPGNLVRKKVVIRDPGNVEIRLLESNEYDTDSEIREALQYILQNGFERTLYDVDLRPDKFGYKLKRRNNEEVFEILAMQNFKSIDDLNGSLQRLIETLDKYAHKENFHILEHILLRPKVNPQEAARSGQTGVPQPATGLLNITHVPDADYFADQKRPFAAYTFKISSTVDPNVKDKTIWKLSLRKGRDTVVVSDDDFLFESHIRTRMEHIREVATDLANFKKEKREDLDGRFTFSIMDFSKRPAQTLAIGAKSYQKEEDIDTEIKSLIKFFSFDVGFFDDENADKIDFSSLVDPYSLRISLFIPTWPVKFSDPGFRHLFEKAVYMETPAHIYPDVYWLDYKDMKEFEIVYKPWLQEISAHGLIPDAAIVNNLIAKLNELRKFSHA